MDASEKGCCANDTAVSTGRIGVDAHVAAVETAVIGGDALCCASLRVRRAKGEDRAPTTRSLGTSMKHGVLRTLSYMLM